MECLSRLDSEEDEELEKLQLLQSKTDPSTSVEGNDDDNSNKESTNTEEPNTSQLGPSKCEYHPEEITCASTCDIFVS